MQSKLSHMIEEILATAEKKSPGQGKKSKWGGGNTLGLRGQVESKSSEGKAYVQDYETMGCCEESSNKKTDAVSSQATVGKD